MGRHHRVTIDAKYSDPWSADPVSNHRVTPFEPPPDRPGAVGPATSGKPPFGSDLEQSSDTRIPTRRPHVM